MEMINDFQKGRIEVLDVRDTLKDVVCGFKYLWTVLCKYGRCSVGKSNEGQTGTRCIGESYEREK